MWWNGMISSMAGITKDRPTYATLPLPGVQPVLLDGNANEIQETEAEGIIAIKHPWPSLARTIYGDHERYKNVYFSAYPGHYFPGDGALRDEHEATRMEVAQDD